MYCRSHKMRWFFSHTLPAGSSFPLFSLGKFQFSRCYMRFKDPAAMMRFARSFDGHPFRNAQGEEHRALVELAPLQRPLRRKLRSDRQMGTLETDPEFKRFVEDSAKEVEPLPSAEVWLEQRSETQAAGPEITPLLQFLQEKHGKKRKGRRERKPGDRAADKSKGVSSAAAGTAAGTAEAPAAKLKRCWVCPCCGAAVAFKNKSCAACKQPRPEKPKTVRVNDAGQVVKVSLRWAPQQFRWYLPRMPRTDAGRIL